MLFEPAAQFIAVEDEFAEAQGLADLDVGGTAGAEPERDGFAGGGHLVEKACIDAGPYGVGIGGEMHAFGGAGQGLAQIAPRDLREERHERRGQLG